MTVNTRATEATTTAEPLDILALYRTMVTARVTNDLLKTRKTQGKFPFYIGCASTTATWGHGCSARAIFMDRYVKPIRVPPGRWARAATCPLTTATGASASCPPSAK